MHLFVGRIRVDTIHGDIMDAALFAQLGPYGGILALVLTLAVKWVSGNKSVRRLKRLEQLVGGSGSSEEKLTQVKLRFLVWGEEDGK